MEVPVKNLVAWTTCFDCSKINSPQCPFARQELIKLYSVGKLEPTLIPGGFTSDIEYVNMAVDCDKFKPLNGRLRTGERIIK